MLNNDSITDADGCVVFEKWDLSIVNGDEYLGGVRLIRLWLARSDLDGVLLPHASGDHSPSGGESLEVDGVGELHPPKSFDGVHELELELDFIPGRSDLEGLLLKCRMWSDRIHSLEKQVIADDLPGSHLGTQGDTIGLSKVLDICNEVIAVISLDRIAMIGTFRIFVIDVGTVLRIDIVVLGVDDEAGRSRCRIGDGAKVFEKIYSIVRAPYLKTLSGDLLRSTVIVALVPEVVRCR